MLTDIGLPYENFRCHPKFCLDDDTIKTNRFVLSIDFSGGGSGDFTVINIFKVTPLPMEVMNRIDEFEDEADFFGLVQVGVFRDNEIKLEEFSKILQLMCTELFTVDRVKVALEMNFKGELLYDKLMQRDDLYWLNEGGPEAK